MLRRRDADGGISIGDGDRDGPVSAAAVSQRVKLLVVVSLRRKYGEKNPTAQILNNHRGLSLSVVFSICGRSDATSSTAAILTLNSR